MSQLLGEVPHMLLTSQGEAVTVGKAKDEQIELLQQELVDVRQKEVDSNAIVYQLKHKMRELENVSDNTRD